MNLFPQNPDARLSPHFLRAEIQCRCCSKLLLDPLILVTLEWARKLAGDKPIFVNSGYRCSPHNEAVGGESNSTHTHGQAVDVYHEDFEELVQAALQLPYVRGLIVHVEPEPRACFVHLDCGTLRRVWGWIGRTKTSAPDAMRQWRKQQEG